MLRTPHAFFRTTGTLALALLAGCGGPPKPSDISGRYIATVSDADMSAPAFLTGELGPRDPSITDTLTVLTLPIQEPATPFAQINVSNSVIGPPNGLTVTRDGRTAFIIETRGQASDSAVTVQDLPPGKHLFAVDLSDPLRPQVTNALDIGSELSNPGEPVSVDVNPAGDLVAVTTKSPGEQIIIVPFRDGRLGVPLAWPLMEVDDTSAAPAAIVWSPDGRHLAVTLPERDQVVFYEFTSDSNAGTFGLRPWGEPVSVGKYPYTGVFTPDGRYFITTNLQWGRDVEDFRVGAPQGSLSVVRLSDIPAEIAPEPGAMGVRTVQHTLVSQATVGISPTGIAVSPDGRLIVTSNLRRSYLADSDPRLTRGGSVSLLAIDGPTGLLTNAGEYEMPAMPLGLTFDAAGRFVLVTQFRSFDVEDNNGWLGVWQVHGGSSPSLSSTDIFIGVGKGPHGVVIVR
ncbi:MAG: beta-propeller fold lactonase family protein [Phycisphaeraceae bacterium]|nr:beta-propeller fold lactonase family protein [Phycisphaeraceae bacterium]